MIGFTVACKRFFGYKQGQDIRAFAEELKQLTPEDKEELRPLLAKELGEEVEIKQVS
jgi:hypothetical protein